jgi:hypothetical protein
MKARMVITAGLLALATTLSVAIGTPGPAAAAPATARAGAVTALLPPPPEPGCFAAGTRIKSPSSPKVYLIDPQGWWDWIPTETDYLNLFGSWSGLVVSSDFHCFRDGGALTGAKLVKTPSSPRVYIWDATYGYYRWIPTGTDFDYYHFDWSKIRVQSSVSPILDSLPWD